MGKCEGWRLALIAVKSISNVSPTGLGFQAATGPANPTDFELSRHCRENPCRFQGSSLNKGVLFHRAKSVSIRDSNTDPPTHTPERTPATNQLGPVSPGGKKPTSAPAHFKVSTSEKTPHPQPNPIPRSLMLVTSYFTCPI